MAGSWLSGARSSVQGAPSYADYYDLGYNSRSNLFQGQAKGMGGAGSRQSWDPLVTPNDTFFRYYGLPAEGVMPTLALLCSLHRPSTPMGTAALPRLLPWACGLQQTSTPWGGLKWAPSPLWSASLGG